MLTLYPIYDKFIYTCNPFSQFYQENYINKRRINMTTAALKMTAFFHKSRQPSKSYLFLQLPFHHSDLTIPNKKKILEPVSLFRRN